MPRKGFQAELERQYDAHRVVQRRIINMKVKVGLERSQYAFDLVKLLHAAMKTDVEIFQYEWGGVVHRLKIRLLLPIESV